MNYAVLKSAAYTLIHTPDMILHNGTTQTTEKIINPDSEYLKQIKNHYRSFEDVLAYPPSQTYIGNITPDELKALNKNTWLDIKVEPKRVGKYGELVPQDEFIAMLKISDVFDLVLLEERFAAKMVEKCKVSELFIEEDIPKIKGVALEELKKVIEEGHCEEIFNNDILVGCVKRAHDVDVNLNAHVIFENLVVKASGVIAFRQLTLRCGLNPADVDYVIECSEEACGDMNQRGGGNFAKAIAELSGAINATGSDLRGFCAAPTHALINAASLVAAGTYENVVIVAGGATAKLGMNGKDHVKKGLPILEDVLGGFAVLISKNDGVSPIIRHDFVGRHTVGTGSSPQAVMNALISMPLEKAGLKVTDVDKYSVEMQNPDVTKPAGAGDVPEGNYKMIAAIGVKRGDIAREQINEFMENHGMPGWAPTQGHIPSGVPYLGFAKDALTTGNLNRVMNIGKGSLFLGRMTNLFDGVSVIIERNSGVTESSSGNLAEEVRKAVANSLREYAAHLLDK